MQNCNPTIVGRTVCFSSLFILCLGLSLAPSRSVAAAATDPPARSNHPIGIFTWSGPWTGYEIWDNQSMLETRPGDTSDIDTYPTHGSIDKLENADIVYLQDHGGQLHTHYFPFPFWSVGEQYRLVDLHIPTDDTEGPSLILAWGCENGRADLVEKYARGLGVLKNSKTKVVVAPKVEVNIFTDTFQEAFFAEFAKGNVTAEQAARTAYATVVKSQGWTRPPAFEEWIEVWGARKLTLDQLRANLDARDRLGRGGMIALQSELRSWYCTNRPKVPATIAAPAEAMRGNLPKATLQQCEDLANRLVDHWNARGMKTAGLAAFQSALVGRLARSGPETTLPPFLRGRGLPPTPPTDAAERKTWSENARRAGLAWWARVLAVDDSGRIAEQLQRRREALGALDPGLRTAADAAIEAARAHQRPQ